MDWGLKARVVLLSALALTAAALAGGPPAAQAPALIGLALVAVLGATWEPGPIGAGTWTALSVAAWVGGTWPIATPADAALTWGIVPAGLAALGMHAHRMTGRLSGTLAISEVARAKLLRSNRELEASMGRTEAALTKLGTVVANLSDGLVAASSDGVVEIANPAVARVLGIAEIAPGARVDAALPAVLASMFGEEHDDEVPSIGEHTLDGGRTVLATVSQVRLHGARWGAVMVVRDITLDRELDRIKSDFAATVSHEMRTPLTSVIGFTKLIADRLEKHVFPLIPEDRPKAARAADTVRRNLDVIAAEGQRLTELISDVLDLSKMESGQVQWAMAPADPRGLVDEAVDALRARAALPAAVALAVATADDLPAVVADRPRIVQVLLNLLVNAAKFTDAGEIAVEAEVDGDAVRFTVRDTGVGIHPAHHEAVFHKFHQLGDVLTDRPRGTGLGLPICRQIVSHHGGRIWVESVPGRGSRFAFTVPSARATLSESTPQEDG